MKVQVRQTALVALLVSLGLIFTSLSTYAMEPAPGGGPRHRKFDDLTYKLDLTEEQQQQIKDLKETKKEKKIAIVEKLHEQMELLRQELEKPNPDKRRVNKIASKVKNYKNQLFDVHIDSVLRMSDILTEDQNIQLQKMYKSRHEKMKRHRGKFKEHFWKKGYYPEGKPCPRKKGF